MFRVFECYTCGAIHSSDEWDKTTRSRFGVEATGIEEPEHIHAYHATQYVCPTCRSILERTDMHEHK